MATAEDRGTVRACRITRATGRTFIGQSLGAVTPWPLGCARVFDDRLDVGLRWSSPDTRRSLRLEHVAAIVRVWDGRGKDWLGFQLISGGYWASAVRGDRVAEALDRHGWPDVTVSWLSLNDVMKAADLSYP